MNREEISNRILRIFKEKEIIDDCKTVDMDISIQNEYGVDSAKLIELIVAIESEFDFEFDDTELDLRNYENINAVVDTVIKHLDESDLNK
ncbi:acyl carrier protein [Wukongibacter sp. M2B1]|uniref:acyl carrier protein n=1 Tax=Wukongibacter sp. M2B1 TaxID=3088895 RepID=UPI003D7943BD